MSTAGYETRQGRMASPVRREFKSFTLKNATKTASESWATQCAAASTDLDHIQKDLSTVKAMAASFADEKKTLCNDLKQLLVTVREATTICKVVQGMEARGQRLTAYDHDSDHRIDVSISPRPSDITQYSHTLPTRSTAFQNALQSVVPLASYSSPQPRPPASSTARALPLPAAPAQPLPPTLAPEISEDDLVVLLLKRQLQRREMELKSLMHH
ncbi:Hypothetical protein, putative [Bodo saltans]|uniref:Uncharacterized protein n=1 Tax=Bodo saltans TaxID=75058 RepID=A0A0S4IJA8_BODSA|nr:Hypothetical protein, putative [Bodo saltans]|eukprot:CUE78213.1 Hypothetical protein, putative [Bodo saltans]